jgi:hypothetical protein
MDSSLEQILRSHYVDGVYHTHVSMINPVGRFQFNRQDIETFWELYCDKVQNEEEPMVGIGEKALQYIPVLVDIDLKLKDEESLQYEEHLYTDDNVMSIIQIYQSVLRDIVEELSDEHLTCVLLEKPIYLLDVGENVYVKNGFHLHFPNIFLNKIDQEVHLIPRVCKMVKEYNVFSNL